jgi:hypothetical protein
MLSGKALSLNLRSPRTLRGLSQSMYYCSESPRDNSRHRTATGGKCYSTRHARAEDNATVHNTINTMPSSVIVTP